MRVQSAYSFSARVMHWSIAAAVIGLIGLGLIMTRASLAIEAAVDLYQAHKSLGLCVAVLMLLRVVVRIQHALPPWPDVMPDWRRRLAGCVHGALYLVLLLLPVSGWLMVSAAPIAFPTTVFGWFEVPHLAALARLPYQQRLPWFEALNGIHRVLGWLLIGLIAVHVAGALLPGRHQLAVRGRMSLWRRRGHDVA